MRKTLQILPAITAYCFALLFIYASISKILDFENFQVQMAQSPLLSAYAGFIPYAVIIAEVIISMLLFVKKTRLIGLYLSLGIMVSFTVYIYLILNYSDFVPCSCGGILEKLGWTEHLIFNLVFVLLSLVAIYLSEVSLKRRFYKTLISSVSLSAISAGVIISLFVSSEHIIKRENNFTRRFLLHPAVEAKALDLRLNSYYFAGTDGNRVYLGNYTAPLNLICIDTTLQIKSQLRIVPDQLKYKFRNVRVSVKRPFYYLYDGSVPIIYRGRLGDSSAHTLSYGNAYFNQLAVVDESKFLIRTQSSKDKHYLLGLLDIKEHVKLALKPDVLEKQIDGVFDVDGRLITNTQGRDLVYMYSYRNQFLVLDSNLKIQRRLNTIDTIQTAKISTVRLSDGRHKMNAPPVKVNTSNTLNRQLLFNQSLLPGKNESPNTWKKASIVDIYRTDRKEYIGSFYIYHKNGAKMTDMLATDQHLYVLIGNELIRYHFRTNITKFFTKGEAENLIE